MGSHSRNRTNQSGAGHGNWTGASVSERQIDLEARFAAHAEQTAAALDSVIRTLEAANQRAEEDKRAFKDSLEKISSDWFRKLDTLSHEINRRFETNRPNWLGFMGLLTAVVVPAAALIGTNVKSSIAPVIERQNIILYQLQEHLSSPGHTDTMVNTKAIEVKVENLKKNLERLENKLDWPRG